MEQLAAWLDRPWKSMKNYFQVTEDYLGEINNFVAKKSMCVARKLECEKMLETSKSVQYDGNKVGLSGSIDMHWPTRGSGKSYNSDA
eukprot:13309321-Ditylum_brightwellii.AAC.1